MNESELLKLVRHCRNALVVIAVSAATLAVIVAFSLIPPLAAAIAWLFGEALRGSIVASLLLVGTIIGGLALFDARADRRKAEAASSR